MASLKDIRQRIVSVKNTQKITRAMKLVAAAKFARANIAVTSSRPYGEAYDRMVRKLVAAGDGEIDSPLTEERPDENSLIVLLATDRGFCGGLNSNLFKKFLFTLKRRKEDGASIKYLGWGRRAQSFLKKIPAGVVDGGREKVLDKPSYELAKELADDLIDRYLKGDCDRVYLTFQKFQSALTQIPTTLQLLPVKQEEAEAVDNPGAANIIAEPNIKELLESLVRKSVASKIFRCMLEATASEHGSRMTAMESATTNADDVIKSLSVDYNRARQAAITNELIEICSGAEAL